jgi:hypothetical protein
MTLVHSGLPDTDAGRAHERGWNHFLDIFPEQFEGNSGMAMPGTDSQWKHEKGRTMGSTVNHLRIGAAPQTVDYRILHKVLTRSATQDEASDVIGKVLDHGICASRTRKVSVGCAVHVPCESFVFPLEKLTWTWRFPCIPYF